MTALGLSFAGSVGGGGSVTVAMRVSTVTLKTLETLRIPLGETRHVQVPQGGRYVVRASLPSGLHESRVVDVGDGETQNVTFDLDEHSSHEYFEWAFLLRPLDIVSGSSLDADGHLSVWMRLWEREHEDQPFRIAPWTPRRSGEGDDGVRLMLESAEPKCRFLQIGGPTTPWRFVALPPHPQIDIMVRGAGHNADHPIEVVVASRDTVSEALLTFLTRGELKAIPEFIEADLHRSREMTRVCLRKMTHPC